MKIRVVFAYRTESIGGITWILPESASEVISSQSEESICETAERLFGILAPVIISVCMGIESGTNAGPAFEIIAGHAEAAAEEVAACCSRG
jgi:hypothetical protein